MAGPHLYGFLGQSSLAAVGILGYLGLDWMVSMGLQWASSTEQPWEQHKKSISTFNFHITVLVKVVHTFYLHV